MKKNECELCGFVFDKDDVKMFNWHYSIYLSEGMGQVILNAGFDTPYEYIKDYDAFCQSEENFIKKFYVFEDNRFYLRKFFRLKQSD